MSQCIVGSRFFPVGSVGYCNRDLSTPYVADRKAWPALHVQGIVAFGFLTPDSRVSGACRDVVDQLAGHGYLGFGCFAQRNPYGVADTVGQKSAYAYGRFDAAIFSLAGFGYSQMKRVVHLLFFHGIQQQPYRFDHNGGVRCFYRYDYIGE